MTVSPAVEPQHIAPSSPSLDAVTPDEAPEASRTSDFGPFVRWLGRTYLKAMGWTIDQTVPNTEKMVLLGYPHTSNWDLPNMLATSLAVGVKISWFGKDALFRPPFGRLMRWLGGIPVDRSSPHGVVDQLKAAFDATDRMVLVVPVSGTRAYRDHWKSGFYWIALAAGVPIGLSYLDYSRKRVAMGKVVYPTGDVKADMDEIRAYFAEVDAKGKFPELASTIRLKNEDDPQPG